MIKKKRGPGRPKKKSTYEPIIKNINIRIQIMLLLDEIFPLDYALDDAEINMLENKIDLILEGKRP
jgi:hypothetical protein